MVLLIGMDILVYTPEEITRMVEIGDSFFNRTLYGGCHYILQGKAKY